MELRFWRIVGVLVGRAGKAEKHIATNRGWVVWRGNADQADSVPGALEFFDYVKARARCEEVERRGVCAWLEMVVVKHEPAPLAPRTRRPSSEVTADERADWARVGEAMRFKAHASDEERALMRQGWQFTEGEGEGGWNVPGYYSPTPVADLS